MMAFRRSARLLADFVDKTCTSFLGRSGRFTAGTAKWSSRRWSEVWPFLLGIGLGILPLSSVSALSWRKRTDEPDKTDTSETIKLRNRKDTELLKSIKLADRTYVVDEGVSQEDIYKILSRHKDKNEPELLWRLARITYELSKKAKSKEKQRLINEAFDTVQKALELDDSNFAAHKWMAIVLNARSTLLGTKEQITQSYNVRKHMERAAELNPRDATSIYLLGNWCFTVAEIPWYQKKIASTIFATPPSCSFAEAVEHFLRAEATEPHFYSMNLLMLAKCYIRLGEPDLAEAYLLQLKSMPTVTEEDYQARLEGKELLDHIQKSKLSKKP